MSVVPHTCVYVHMLQIIIKEMIIIYGKWKVGFYLNHEIKIAKKIKFIELKLQIFSYKIRSKYKFTLILEKSQTSEFIKYVNKNVLHEIRWGLKLNNIIKILYYTMDINYPQ